MHGAHVSGMWHVRWGMCMSIWGASSRPAWGGEGGQNAGWCRRCSPQGISDAPGLLYGRACSQPQPEDSDWRESNYFG